jgi:hypothetical protein
MALVVVVVLVAFVWWLVSSNKAAQRAHDLDHWEHDWSPDPDILISVRVHFPSMTMRMKQTSYDVPGADSESEYTIRRRSDGSWEMLLTPESLRAQMAELSASISKAGALTGMIEIGKERMEKLARNEWEPLTPEIATVLDTAYERHVHQPR